VGGCVGQIGNSADVFFFSDTACLSAGAALKANRSVERLLIANNDIGAPGAKAIGIGLTVNETMVYVCRSITTICRAPSRDFLVVVVVCVWWWWCVWGVFDNQTTFEST
jgi:hypothetical protein